MMAIRRTLTRRMLRAFGLRLHHREPRVVVRKLLEVRPGDLARHDLVVIRDVGLRVVRTVLELDAQAQLELFGVEG
jgi:hypothetical protein